MDLKARLLGIGVAVYSLFGCGAHAKDLEFLTRLLVPPYLAQNFAELCVSQDREFLAELDQGAALVTAFAEHVKSEVTIDLAESHAAVVRITAAKTARSVAEQELRALSGQSDAIPGDVLRRWCDQAAKQYIVDLMNAHQEQHAEILKRVDEAKR